MTTFLTPLVAWLDLFGIAVFAASGALAAARARQTLVTFSFFALVTGVGGGTVRDLLIGVPVFWVHDWRVPAVCLVDGGARVGDAGAVVARAGARLVRCSRAGGLCDVRRGESDGGWRSGAARR